MFALLPLLLPDSYASSIHAYSARQPPPMYWQVAGTQRQRLRRISARHHAKQHRQAVIESDRQVRWQVQEQCVAEALATKHFLISSFASTTTVVVLSSHCSQTSICARLIDSAARPVVLVTTAGGALDSGSTRAAADTTDAHMIEQPPVGDGRFAQASVMTRADDGLVI